MATLEGHQPLIALRSRGRQPASLLAVVLIAAATLCLAIVIAELADSTGGSSTPVMADERARAPAHEADSPYLSPRGTEIPPGQSSLPRGYTRHYEGSSLSVVPAEPSAAADGSRSDGGPEEGSRGPGR
jgi:hypothetical protein